MLAHIFVGTMKRLATLLLFIPAFYSCKRTEVNEIPQEVGYAEVPNWLETAMIADMPGGGTDTVFAYTLNDRSYIRYKGLPYHVRAQKGLIDYRVSDTGRAFYISVFDGRDRQILDCFVSPGQYRREDRMLMQPQAFRPVQTAPFVNNRIGDYVSR